MKKEDVNKMTLGEAVNFALGKIVEQGGRCLKVAGWCDNPICAYGNGDGKHCAVGWLLDEDNDTLMSSDFSVEAMATGRSMKSIDRKRFEGLIPELICDNVDVFKELQHLHDVELDYGYDRARLNGTVNKLVELVPDIDRALINKWIAILEEKN